MRLTQCVPEGTVKNSFANKQLSVAPIDSPHTTARLRVILSVGGMTCVSCTNAITSALSELPGVTDVSINLLGNSATLNVSNPEDVPAVMSAVEDIGYSAEVIAVEPIRATRPPTKPSSREDGPLHVDLSVDGMTCVSCVNTVTGLLLDIPGVTHVSVNLIGKSATATIQHRKLIPQLEEAVNDAGYEAEVVNVRGLDADSPSEDVLGPRTISLCVDGMYCS